MDGQETKRSAVRPVHLTDLDGRSVAPGAPEALETYCRVWSDPTARRPLGAGRLVAWLLRARTVAGGAVRFDIAGERRIARAGEDVALPVVEAVCALGPPPPAPRCPECGGRIEATAPRRRAYRCASPRCASTFTRYGADDVAVELAGGRIRALPLAPPID